LQEAEADNSGLGLVVLAILLNGLADNAYQPVPCGGVMNSFKRTEILPGNSETHWPALSWTKTNGSFFMADRDRTMVWTRTSIDFEFH